MASLLLAGGTLSTVEASIQEMTPGQYYRMAVAAANGTQSAYYLDSDADRWYTASADAVADRDGSSWWTVERVLDPVTKKPIAYKLVNKKGVYYKVKAGDKSYDTFAAQSGSVKVTITQAQNEPKTEYWGLPVYGQSVYAYENVANASSETIWGFDNELILNAPLSKDELDKQNGDSFSIQIGYEADEDKDGKNEWHEYTTFEGGNVFAGKLYVGTLDKKGNVESGENATAGYALYKDANRTQRVVLTKNKWEKVSSTLSFGYIFDVLSAEEYNEETNKEEKDNIILADKFIISVPSTVKGEPIEVVATDGTNKYELVVSVVKNAAGKDVNRLTVAGAKTENTADYNLQNVENGGNTYVKFGNSLAVNTEDFIGKLWNIYKNGRILSPANGLEWLATSEVYTNGTEGLWMWNEDDKKFYNRESGESFTPTGWYDDNDASTEYTYVAGEDVYTLVAQGTPAPEGTTDGYLSYLTDDQLKQRAFNIGTPRVTLNGSDTVYLAKGKNGVLGFTTDQTEAVEFRLTRKAFDNANKFMEAQLRGEYSAWKKNSTTDYEEKTDIVKLYQYTIEDAVTGEVLVYDSKDNCYILSDDENATRIPYVFKEKGDKVYNILLNIKASVSADNKYYEVTETTFGPQKANAKKLYGAHNANHLVEADNVYENVENDLFVVVDAAAQQYRGDFSDEGTLDTIKIFRNDDPSYVLYEKGTLLADAKGEAIEGFLGMENVLDPQYADMQPALLADTAKHANTYRPQYMLAVDAKVVPAGKYCPICGEDDCAHAVATKGFIEGRYLVTLADSAKAAADAGVKEAANKFKHEGFYRLGFVQAKHIGDSLIIASGKTAQDTIDVSKGYDMPCTFAFKYVDAERRAFTIETMLEKGYDKYDKYAPAENERGYIKYQNGVPVVTGNKNEAWVFDLEELTGEENAPTANEEISAGNVAVAGVNGAVVVKGAEGKNVIVSTILGKVVANEVVSSDNAQIAAPAGIVVVSVDGESFKVVVK